MLHKASEKYFLRSTGACIWHKWNCIYTFGYGLLSLVMADRGQTVTVVRVDWENTVVMAVLVLSIFVIICIISNSIFQWPSRNLDRTLVHLDADTIHKPSFNETHKLFGDTLYDWSNNHALHLWHTMWPNRYPDMYTLTPEDIKTLNTTFGQVARYVYYNSSELIDWIDPAQCMSCNSHHYKQATFRRNYGNSIIIIGLLGPKKKF